jgi:hypothetical protein
MALPPTSSKISSDTNEVTTFKFDFPNFTGTHTGTLVSLDINSVAGGGTGLASLTANNVILGNGTSSPTFVAPGASGNVLTSNGTTWLSSTPSSGSVTSVALAAPAIFTVTGSPVTTAGTLTLSYSGTALPTANGGTGTTSSGTQYGLVYYATTTSMASTAAGSPGQVLTSNGTSPPTFQTFTNGFQYFASSQVTTRSSAVATTTFSTFSNSPAFTFTPTITGKYKVYSNCTYLTSAGNHLGNVRIFNTTGGATLLQESQAANYTGNALDTPVDTVFIQSVYTLTSGTPYVFDIQGKIDSVSFVVELAGDQAPFYMFAELCG